MVGIVIVSHSENLARGLKELALQMVQGQVNIEIAAGIDDPENPLGTDTMQIYQAIERVYSDDGVAIFTDLGSAILSAEMAIEFLSETQQNNVKLSDSPLVEGVISAVIQAAVGGNLAQVLKEAQATLTAKSNAIKMTKFSDDLTINYPKLSEGSPQEILITIANSMGLHARPAAKLVETANQFTSDIKLRNVTTNSKSADAKSISQVMTLGVRYNHQITFTATGVDATEALNALEALSLINFGDSLEQNREQNQPQPIFKTGEFSSDYQGVSVSPGIAIAPIYQYQSNIIEVPEEYTENPQIEWSKLQTAIATAKQKIKEIRQETFLQVGETHASIFDAHLLCLQDPTILEQVNQLIFTQKLTAYSAWNKIILTIVQEYKNLSDSYLQNRAQDWEDVGNRVGQLLTKNLVKSLVLPTNVILVAEDLNPSQVAQLDMSKVVGLCLIKGNKTSHAAILAQALALPTIIGLNANLLTLKNDTLIGMDGETGEIWLQPNADKIQELERKKAQEQAAFELLQLSSQQSAITTDGKHISVLANISGLADAKIAQQNGAEGIGLFRTEFLYLDREQEPNEDEQMAIYQAIAQMISPHPLIIRLLDIGGDKPLSFTSSLSHNLNPESNPFLGVRGIRLLLQHPDLLKKQLRAILRASLGQNIKILLPMISSLNEVRKFKEIMSTVKTDLAENNIPFLDKIELGIMIEVPSAVAIADKLAKEVDFFSIGTNDLTQYIMASDRTNPQVSALSDAFEPAVLRMIQQTIMAAHNANILVTVCGELASSPLATAILLGLGVDELSLTPPAIPVIKSTITQLNFSETQAIASFVLKLDTAADVKKYLREKNFTQ